MIDKSEVAKVVSLLNGLSVPYYFYAGFGLHLRGIKGELDDCDVRVYHPDIQEVYDHLANRISRPITLKHAKRYSRGTYKTPYIELTMPHTIFHIGSRMIADNDDIGTFEFPFDEATFKDVDWLPFKGLKLPTASLETLLLYYLVYRRGEVDGKNDERTIKDLLNSPQLNKEKFKRMIPSLRHSDKIDQLYRDRLSKYT